MIARAVRSRFPQTWDLWKRASVSKCVGRVSLQAVSRWLRSPGCCVFGGVLWVRRDFFEFLFSFLFFFEHTRPAASMRPPLASFTSRLVIPTWWRVGPFLSFYCLPLVQRLMFLRLCHSPEEIRYF